MFVSESLCETVVNIFLCDTHCVTDSHLLFTLSHWISVKYGGEQNLLWFQVSLLRAEVRLRAFAE